MGRKSKRRGNQDPETGVAKMLLYRDQAEGREAEGFRMESFRVGEEVGREEVGGATAPQ